MDGRETGLHRDGADLPSQDVVLSSTSGRRQLLIAPAPAAAVLCRSTPATSSARTASRGSTRRERGTSRHVRELPVEIAVDSATARLSLRQLLTAGRRVVPLERASARPAVVPVQGRPNSTVTSARSAQFAFRLPMSWRLHDDPSKSATTRGPGRRLAKAGASSRRGVEPGVRQLGPGSAATRSATSTCCSTSRSR